MIPDLIRISQVRHYIYERTGVWVTPYRVKKWLKEGTLPRYQPKDKKTDRYVRRNDIDKLIKERVK